MIVNFSPMFRQDWGLSSIKIAHVQPAGYRDIFFAVLCKMGSLVFLWSQRMLSIQADFEQSKLVLEMEGIVEEITFRDLLRYDEKQLVELHMRKLAAAVARKWELPNTATVIEQNGDVNDAFFKEFDRHSMHHDTVHELTGLLLTLEDMGGEYPKDHWSKRDFFREQTEAEAIAACRAGDFSQFPKISKPSVFDRLLRTRQENPKELKFTQEEYDRWKEQYQRL
jgi:hypothetical protein